MAETKFEITYDGDDLKTGQMPVRDLAPALIALGDLFVRASQKLYPDREPVALNLKATETGSFTAQLILQGAEAIWDAAMDLGGGDPATALANIKEIVIDSGVGILAFIRRAEGKEVEKEPSTTPGHIKVTFPDGTKLETPSAVVEMYEDVEVRKDVRQVVAPLRREGVDVLEFREETKVSVRVTKSDVPKFEIARREDEPVEQEVEWLVQIAGIFFQPGHKWRFTIGEQSFWAAIEDHVFLERVSRRQDLFGHGDTMRCRIKVTQRVTTEGKIQTDYSILEVLDHRPGPFQLSFDSQDSEP